jgi:outer membrane protein
MKIRQAMLGLLAFGALQTASAADLMQIYQQARMNDAQFAAAQQQYKALRQNAPIARSALLPQANLSANVARNHMHYNGVVSQGAAVPDGSKEYNSNGYTVSLSQTLFNYSDWAGLKQADKTVAAAQANLDAASQSLVLRTAEAYFNVLSAEDQLRFSKAQDRAIRRQLDQAKKRYEVGLVPITDVKQARASYDLARAQTIKARSTLDTAREALTVITGQGQEPLAPLAGKLPLVSPKPTNMQKWVKAALQQNLSLVAARYNAEAAGEEVSKQRAGHYPTLDLVASHSYNDNGTGASQSGKITDDAIALQLNVPLFSGFRVSAQTDQAQYKYMQVQQELKGLQRQTISQTRSAYLNVQSSISQVEALRQAVESNEASVKATQAGFKVGTKTSLDVLTALSDLYKAQSEYSQARYTYLVDTLRLKQAAGVLTTADIERINAYLAGSDTQQKNAQ